MFIHANLFFLLCFCYLVGLKLSFSRLCLSKLSHERYEMEAHPSMFSERAAFFSFYDPAEQALQSGIYLQNYTLQPHAIHFENNVPPPLDSFIVIVLSSGALSGGDVCSCFQASVRAAAFLFVSTRRESV